MSDAKVFAGTGSRRRTRARSVGWVLEEARLAGASRIATAEYTGRGYG